MMFQRALRDMANAERRFDRILHEAMNTTTTTVTLEAPASAGGEPLKLASASQPSSLASSPQASSSQNTEERPKTHRDWLSSLTHRTAAGGVRRRASVSTGTAPVVAESGTDVMAATADTKQVARRTSKQAASLPTPRHPQIPTNTQPEPCDELVEQMDAVDVTMFRLSQHQQALGMHYSDAQAECRVLTRKLQKLCSSLEAEYGRVKRTLYKDYASLKYQWVKVGEKLESLGGADALPPSTIAMNSTAMPQEDAGVAIQRGELVRSLEQYQVEAEAAARRLRVEYDRMIAEYTPKVQTLLVEISRMQCRLCIDVGASWKNVYPEEFVHAVESGELAGEEEEVDAPPAAAGVPMQEDDNDAVIVGASDVPEEVTLLPDPPKREPPVPAKDADVDDGVLVERPVEEAPISPEVTSMVHGIFANLTPPRDASIEAGEGALDDDDSDDELPPPHAKAGPESRRGGVWWRKSPA